MSLDLHGARDRAEGDEQEVSISVQSCLRCDAGVSSAVLALLLTFHRLNSWLPALTFLICRKEGADWLLMKSPAVISAGMGSTNVTRLPHAVSLSSAVTAAMVSRA
jgi:hypothetical protein